MRKNTNEELDILTRYKKSMIVDSIFFIILFLGLLIPIGTFFEIYRLQVELIVLPIIIFVLLNLFLQDFIFGRSIGKKIYKLKIVTNIKSKKKLLKSLVIRRVLESTYNKDFDALNNMIEAVTETKIVDENHIQKQPKHYLKR